MRRSAESSIQACSTATPNSPYDTTPSTQCTGAHGLWLARRTSPGKTHASTTAAQPTSANARRTAGSGSMRLSIACTSNTSHTVSDNTGANPRRAPCPAPAMSTTSARP